MTNSVNLNGNTYTDDSNASTGLGNGGHRTRFIPALSDFLVEAAAKIQACVDQVALALGYKNDAATSATAAASSAASAANAPGTSATSTTSISVGTGSKTFTIQTGKSFAIGQKVNIARTSDPSGSYMFGAITAHDSATGSMTVSVVTTVGTGTYTDWTVSLSGERGLSLVAWQRKTGAYTAISGERIAVGTTSAAVTITLPASPSANDFVEFMDDDGAFDTNNLTIARNGQTIMGAAEDMTVATNNISFGLRFNGTTWRIY
ncbi:hypothetical protein [Herbaspirillum sp. ST 5-3]|uniref:hypothetical protein n=1 Tax=Oxalobacteraceae TaxID=75682 RepID=UPI0010A38298|nr:hypothetical protein [Herbaspirillum sp. ST 5-3]